LLLARGDSHDWNNDEAKAQASSLPQGNGFEAGYVGRPTERMKPLFLSSNI
jgi:hypothetical protein